ncbi:hypothetical protein ES705_31316 [subsurface metagenome]
MLLSLGPWRLFCCAGKSGRLKLQEISQKIAIFPAKYSTLFPVRGELFRDEQRLISGQSLSKIPVIMEICTDPFVEVQGIFIDPFVEVQDIVIDLFMEDG